MSNSTTANSGGIGVLGLLGVVFVTLKLIGIIDWSWWWVTAPFWGEVILVLSIAGSAGLLVAVLELFQKRRRN
ncbi:MAG: hypothetical protein ACKO0Z_15790 [Betaproteobacteria bacterium]